MTTYEMQKIEFEKTPTRKTYKKLIERQIYDSISIIDYENNRTILMAKQGKKIRGIYKFNF